MTDIDVRNRATRLLTSNDHRFEIREALPKHYTLWIAADTGRWYATSITIVAPDMKSAEPAIFRFVLENCDAKLRVSKPSTDSARIQRPETMPI